MATLNWGMRAVLAELAQGHRLTVLTALMLRANVRNRCYPSLDVLETDTGVSRPTVVKAVRWLSERGALEIVKAGKRVDDERDLPARQHVYQLTGVIRDERGDVHHYLYTGRSDFDSKPNLLSKVNVVYHQPDLPKDSSIEVQVDTKDVPADAGAQGMETQPSKKRTASPEKEKRTGTPRAARPADAVFDAVCIHLFNVNPKGLKTEDGMEKAGGRFGMIASAARRIFAECYNLNQPLNDDHTGKCANSLRLFAGHWRSTHNGAAMPTGVGGARDSFSTHYLAFLNQFPRGRNGGTPTAQQQQQQQTNQELSEDDRREAARALERMKRLTGGGA